MRIAAGLAVLALAAALVMPLASACATTPSSSSATPRARDYFPLAVGNHWTYHLTPAPPGQGTGDVKIVDKDAQGFFLDDKGGRVAPRTDGVFDGVKNRFLLEEPIENGHAWIAVPKDDPSTVEHYKIVDTAASVHVPAGDFDGCVEVLATQTIKNPNTGERGTLETRWTYASGVGLVKLVQKIVPEKSQPFVTATMDLVYFEVKPAG